MQSPSLVRASVSLVLVAGGLALALPAAAQTPDQIAEATRALEWRPVGPTIMGGRVSDLAVVESVARQRPGIL